MVARRSNPKAKRLAKAGCLHRTKQSKRSPSKRTIDPTRQAYGLLNHACAFLNRHLFDGMLPPCLVTLQRKRRAYGFFAGRRFRSTTGAHVIDEIALNPEHFAERGAKKVLSTLAHERAHQWQHHFGKPSRSGYHNIEWAAKMRSIGLIPSDTGRRGGKQTGDRVTHCIERGGPFDRAADKLIEKGFTLAIVERTSKKADLIALKKRKATYQCPKCSAKAWTKPESDFMCRPCRARLVRVA
jgi:predicted SprT family Zn-dependent metalloprotease